MAATGDSFKYSGAAPANDPAWRVVIAIGPSGRVRRWILAAGTTALAATLAAGIPAPAQAAIVLALGVAAIRDARRLAWREGPGAVVRIAVDLPGRVEVDLADGRRLAGRLAQGSFVAPWLTIVRWRPVGARFDRTILVAPDAVEAGAFRRLRILLRWR